MFPIVARYFSSKNGISNKLLAVVDLQDEKAETMEIQIERICRKFEIMDKCVCFCADNAPTNFGGLQRGGKKNLFAQMKTKFSNLLYGLGCNAHIAHNTVDRAVGNIELFDVEAIVVKIYKHFCQHTVRVTHLKAICDEAGIGYQKLLGYGQTRFLAFKGCIDRIITLFEALKTFFLNEENSQPALYRFFKCPIAKLLLIFIRDECQIFEEAIEKMEGDNVTGFTAFEIMNDLKTSAECRLKDEFRSSAFRDELKLISNCIPFEMSFLEKKSNEQRNSHVTIDDNYMNEIFNQFHKDCINYLEKWIEPLKELKIWAWAALKKVPDWKEIEPCVDVLMKKGFFVESDDIKLHAEYCNLKLIIENLLPKWENEMAQYKQVKREREEARNQQAASRTSATASANTQQKAKKITAEQLKAMKVTTESKWMDVCAALVEKELSFDRIFKLIEYAMVIPGI